MPNSRLTGRLASWFAPPTWWAWSGLALVAITTGGLLVGQYRLVDWLDTPGLFGDEAMPMRDASQRMLLHLSDFYTIAWGGVPAMYFMLLGQAFRFFGMSIYSARMVSVVMASVCIPMIYALCRELGLTRRAGLLAASLLAGARWGLTINRLAWPIAASMPAVLLCMLLVLKAWRSGRWWLYVLAGLSITYALNQYIGSQVVVPVIVGWAACLAFLRPAEPVTNFSRRSGRAPMSAPGERTPARQRLAVNVAALLATVAVTMAPWIPYYLAHPDQFESRGIQAYVLGHEGIGHWKDQHPGLPSDPITVLRTQMVAAAGMFTHKGDCNPLQNLPCSPMLDAATGWLFVIGLILSLRYWRRAEWGLVLLWLVLGVFFGTVLTTDAPSARRTIVVLPAVMVYCGLSLDRIMRAGNRLAWQLAHRAPAAGGAPAGWNAAYRTRWESPSDNHQGLIPITVGTLLFLGLAVWTSTIVLHNLQSYFVQYASRGDVRLVFNPAETAAALYLQQFENIPNANVTLYSAGQSVGQVFDALVPRLHLTGLMVHGQPTTKPEPSQPVAVVFLYDSPALRAAIRQCQARYPGVSVVSHYGPGNQVLFYSMTLARNQPAAAQDHAP